MMLQLILVVILATASPTLLDEDVQLPPNWCQLYPELGGGGTLQFLEDCNSTDRFESVPVPAPYEEKLGVHPRVCCPTNIRFNIESGTSIEKLSCSPDAICLPSGPLCSTYEAEHYGDEYEEEYEEEYGEEYEEYYGDYDYESEEEQPEPTMADEFCSNPDDTCTTLNKCSNLLDKAKPDIPETCGFDKAQSLLMVCCPAQTVKEAGEDLVQKPRFPARNGSARKCEDKSKLCSRWKTKGCRLDEHVKLGGDQLLQLVVNSLSLFDFMQTACTSSCELCGSKGCVDEHPRCPEWARGLQYACLNRGLCLTSSLFMAHTCRESCGVCGFLSPHNLEVQQSEGDSYTELSGANFDCGRNKRLCEVQGTSCEEKERRRKRKGKESNNDIGVVDLRQREKPVEVFTSADVVVENAYCGATIISDRWAVSTAHCYDDQPYSDKKRTLRIRIGTQFEESVEVRNVYKHPGYTTGRLYNDLAVLELGRRIEYDFERYGDSPICIDQGLDKKGKIGTVQGYGETEEGTSGKLLEANVKVISNQKCKEILETRITDPSIFEALVRSIPLGLQEGMMCTEGIYNPLTNQTTGPCKGDTGGPLFLEGSNKRKTLVGIVSGGVSCGTSFPSWLTRVEYFSKWIRCILEQAVRFKNQHAKVSEQCELDFPSGEVQSHVPWTMKQEEVDPPKIEPSITLKDVAKANRRKFNRCHGKCVQKQCLPGTQWLNDYQICVEKCKNQCNQVIQI